MELKTLSVAIAATLSSTAAFAMSEPVAQVTEKVEHHQHEHGVETAQPEYAPTELLPQLPKQTLRTRATQSVEASSVVCDVESFTTTNSNDLISAIKTQGANCINELFSAQSRVQEAAFDSDHMYNVAKHTVTLAKAILVAVVMSLKPCTCICALAITPSFTTTISRLFLGSRPLCKRR